MDVLFSQGDESVELSASIKATKHSKEKITVCSFLAELTLQINVQRTEGEEEFTVRLSREISS